MRRFTSALLAIARKNAKSTLAAAILLYCLCCEAESGRRSSAAATTGDQARIVFGVAKRMVERRPTCARRTARAVRERRSRGGRRRTFKPINAKASTQDGLNPSHVVLDEVHAHKTHDLLNVLQSAAGARANPLWLYTTTEGYETPGPWPELRHFAKQVLEEVVEADHFLALYFALDDKDDDFDESKWIKANPLMDVNPVLATESARRRSKRRRCRGGRRSSASSG
jgi:phage terminase large subunit-like protein